MSERTMPLPGKLGEPEGEKMLVAAADSKHFNTHKMDCSQRMFFVMPKSQAIFTTPENRDFHIHFQFKYFGMHACSKHLALGQ